jgi:hypothetical protein
MSQKKKKKGMAWRSISIIPAMCKAEFKANPAKLARPYFRIKHKKA